MYSEPKETMFNMKYTIMSDAHANPAALKKTYEDACGQGCEKFVFLGDATGYGYDAKGTVDFLRDNFDVVLMGNHDSVCVNAGIEDLGALNRNYDIDRAQRSELTDDDVKWLQSRDYRYDCGEFSCVHGDFSEPEEWNYIYASMDVWCNLGLVDARVAFCGHTHHACVWEKVDKRKLCVKFDDPQYPLPLKPESLTTVIRKNRRYIVNCGSVGYPRTDLCSTYAIYNADTEKISIRRLPFDFGGYVDGMLGAGIPLPHWLLQHNLRSK